MPPKTFFKPLLYLWQLPQNLIGLLFLLFLRKRASEHFYSGIRYYFAMHFHGGITLGEYIIVGSTNAFTIKHEYGHVRQSRLLGPLYLLVIGLPSLLHAAIYPTRRQAREGVSYYAFYTERWADRLGGIHVSR